MPRHLTESRTRQEGREEARRTPAGSPVAANVRRRAELEEDNGRRPAEGRGYLGAGTDSLAAVEAAHNRRIALGAAAGIALAVDSRTAEAAEGHQEAVHTLDGRTAEEEEDRREGGRSLDGRSRDIDYTTCA